MENETHVYGQSPLRSQRDYGENQNLKIAKKLIKLAKELIDNSKNQ